MYRLTRTAKAPKHRAAPAPGFWATLQEKIWQATDVWDTPTGRFGGH